MKNSERIKASGVDENSLFYRRAVAAEALQEIIAKSPDNTTLQTNGMILVFAKDINSELSDGIPSVTLEGNRTLTLDPNQTVNDWNIYSEGEVVGNLAEYGITFDHII